MNVYYSSLLQVSICNPLNGGMPGSRNKYLGSQIVPNADFPRFFCHSVQRRIFKMASAAPLYRDCDAVVGNEASFIPGTRWGRRKGRKLGRGGNQNATLTLRQLFRPRRRRPLESLRGSASNLQDANTNTSFGCFLFLFWLGAGL